MMTMECTRMSMEDKRELEKQIKEKEKEVEFNRDWFPVLNDEAVKELRRLRRLRT